MVVFGGAVLGRQVDAWLGLSDGATTIYVLVPILVFGVLFITWRAVERKQSKHKVDTPVPPDHGYVKGESVGDRIDVPDIGVSDGGGGE